MSSFKCAPTKSLFENPFSSSSVFPFCYCVFTDTPISDTILLCAVSLRMCCFYVDYQTLCSLPFLETELDDPLLSLTLYPYALGGRGMYGDSCGVLE